MLPLSQSTCFACLFLLAITIMQMPGCWCQASVYQTSDELKMVRDRIAEVRAELEKAKVRMDEGRNRETETDRERYLQDTRGAPYTIDKKYHDVLDGKASGQREIVGYEEDDEPGSKLDMDYCSPSFANQYFFPSNRPSNVALHRPFATSSGEANAIWRRNGGAAVDVRNSPTP